MGREKWKSLQWWTPKRESKTTTWVQCLLLQVIWFLYFYFCLKIRNNSLFLLSFSQSIICKMIKIFHVNVLTDKNWPQDLEIGSESQLLVNEDGSGGRLVLLWNTVAYLIHVCTVLILLVNVFPHRCTLVQPFNNSSVLHWRFLGSWH